MKKCKMIKMLMILLILPSIVFPVYAHPGRTDSQGGHTDHSTGAYHYHHGYSAHDHYDMDGDGDIDCPYDFRDNPRETQGNKSGDTSKEKESTQSVDTRKPDAPKSDAKSGIASFVDTISTIFEYLFIGITLWLFSSYFLFYIFYFIFGEEQGCFFSMIVGAVISIAVCIWLLS